MISLRKIHYKGTSQPKSNTYIWTGVVDKNGRMLKEIPESLSFEFFEQLYEQTQVHSDILIDEWGYEQGIQNNMKKFFKVVSYSLWEKEIKNLRKRDYGRILNKNLYSFSNFYIAFINNEIFFKKSVLWIIGSLQTLEDWAPFIDRCNILRVNHDFAELFGEDALQPGSFDDIVRNHYSSNSSLRPESSKKFCDITNARQTLRNQPEQEVWDNGMIITKVGEFSKNRRTSEEHLPVLWDYKYEFFKKIISHPDTQNSETSSKVRVLESKRKVDPKDRFKYMR